MGVSASIPCVELDKDPEGMDNPASADKKAALRFLDQYKLGKFLGDGAFGVVSSCSRRSTGEEFAVKMVNTVENEAADVWREAQMLRSLDHTNIVKFHGIFPERRVLCIVMDKFSGGDLVEGLQRHGAKHGRIPGEEIVGATRQMASAIRYLHNLHHPVIHRDVKGDNYLMDRPEITDPALHIVLTDFGAARSVERGERMSDVVGTKKFSPPEFFDRDYGVKRDVWALGVVMYGLATGRFPFRDESEVRNKTVILPKTVYPALVDIIHKMLERNEERRLDSEQLMCHPYLAEGADAAPAEGEEAAVGSPVPVALRAAAARAGKAGVPGGRGAGGEPGDKESLGRSPFAPPTMPAPPVEAPAATGPGMAVKQCAAPCSVPDSPASPSPSIAPTAVPDGSSSRASTKDSAGSSSTTGRGAEDCGLLDHPSPRAKAPADAKKAGDACSGGARPPSSPCSAREVVLGFCVLRLWGRGWRRLAPWGTSTAP